MQKLDREDILKFSALIDAADKVTILVHTHPDGDALGSGLGMMRYLASLGKRSTLILPTTAPDTLSFLPVESDGPVIVANQDKSAAEKAVAEASLIICQDFNNITRSEGMEESFAAATAPKVLIDHHIGPDRASFDIVFSETEISSASELVYWVLKALPQTEQLPLGTLNALMTGMTTDTNNFRNSTFPSTLQMASECVAAGVDREAVVSNIYNKYRENRYRLMGYFLSEKLKTTPLGVAYAVLSKEELDRFGIREGETESFVNMPLEIDEIRMSLFLKEQDGVFRVSIRSKKGTSASRCCNQYFNGGGHENAAGGKLPIGERIPDAAAAEKYIVEATTAFFENE